MCAHTWSCTWVEDLPSQQTDACEEGEDIHLGTSGMAKSIMVNNAFIPATSSLKYCEITYCFCTVCLFSWTALDLVKLLKVPELQHS